MLILLTSILQQSAEAWANKEDMFQGCRVLDLLAAGDKTSGLELSFVWNNSFAVKYVCIAIYLQFAMQLYVLNGEGGGGEKTKTPRVWIQCRIALKITLGLFMILG